MSASDSDSESGRSVPTVPNGGLPLDHSAVENYAFDEQGPVPESSAPFNFASFTEAASAHGPFCTSALCGVMAIAALVFLVVDVAIGDNAISSNRQKAAELTGCAASVGLRMLNKSSDLGGCSTASSDVRSLISANALEDAVLRMTVELSKLTQGTSFEASSAVVAQLMSLANFEVGRAVTETQGSHTPTSLLQASVSDVAVATSPLEFLSAVFDLPVANPLAEHRASSSVLARNLAVDREAFAAIASMYATDELLVSDTESALEALLQVAPSAQRDTFTDQVSLVCLCLLAGFSVILVLFFTYLAINRHSNSTAEAAAVLEAEFEVKGGLLRPTPRNLQAVSVICAQHSVMQPLKAHDKDMGQIALALRACERTLRALRPFVPPYVFSHRTVDAYGISLPRLNMTTDLVPDYKGCVLYVSLAHFNGASAQVDVFSDFLAVVHDCVSRWGGTVAQIASEAMIVVMHTDTLEEDPSLDQAAVDMDPELRGAHCAFAILANAAQIRYHDTSGTLQLGCPCSLAILRGTMLRGMVPTFLSRPYFVVSPVLIRGRTLASMNVEYGTCLLTDGPTAQLLEEHILVRPIHLHDLGHRETMTVFELVMEHPDKEVVPNYDAAMAQFSKHKERIGFWCRTWTDFETAFDQRSPEKLIAVYRSLQTYAKLFGRMQEAPLADDVAYHRTLQFVVHALADIHVSVDDLRDK